MTITYAQNIFAQNTKIYQDKSVFALSELRLDMAAYKGQANNFWNSKRMTTVFDLHGKTAITQNYTKFTNQPGPMPTVCINMWQV